MIVQNFLSSQRGNVLFLILIAVALFGALSFAVSSMMRGGQDIDDAQAGVYASDVLSYGQDVYSAVQMLYISSGCADTDISFESAPFDGSDASYVNGNSPSDLTCHVFSKHGGGASDQTPPDQVNSGAAWVMTGKNSVPKIGNNGTADLVMILPGLKKLVCLEINKRLDIDAVSGDAPTDTDGFNTDAFTGSYSDSADIGLAANFGKKSAGCYKDTNADPDTYNFYQVLLAR